MSSRIILSEKNEDGAVTELYESSQGSPEIYVDGIQGIMMKAGVCKFNFFTEKMPSDNKKNYREVACTLIIPSEQLKGIGEIFIKIASQVDGEISLEDLVNSIEQRQGAGATKSKKKK